MIVKCNCNNCSQHIEFDTADAGRSVQCPSCGMDTKLYVPTAPKQKAPVNKAAIRPVRQIEEQLASIGRAYWGGSIITAALVLVGAATAHFVGESNLTAGATLLAAIAILWQGWVLGKLFTGAGEVIRLLRRIEENTYRVPPK